jgi:hypothetical protein
LRMDFHSPILYNVLGVIEARQVDYIDMKLQSMNNRYLTIIVCLLFLTGIGIGSMASVVCVCDDGHVKMEALCLYNLPVWPLLHQERYTK